MIQQKKSCLALAIFLSLLSWSGGVASANDEPDVQKAAVSEQGASSTGIEETKSAEAVEASEIKEESAPKESNTAPSSEQQAAMAKLYAEAMAYPEVAPFGPYPRFSLHGNYRVTYGEGRLTYPALGNMRQKVYQVSRRLQLYPSIAFDPEWTLTGMLEDIRYDREYPESHASDNHLYLDRLYVRQTTQHDTRFTLGRENIWPIEGNLFDLITEGVRYEFGNKDREGRVDFFAGRTIGKSSRLNKEKKEGVILSYMKNFNERFQGGLLYYDFHRDDDDPVMNFMSPDPSSLVSSYLATQNVIDHQNIGELYLKYNFTKDMSIEFEGMLGHASTDLDNPMNFGDYSDTAAGYIFTYRLRQQPNIMKPGDYGLWISYYNMPRPTYIAPTLDADVSIFGRSGFKGIGARLDVVLTRGLLWQVMYYNLHNRTNDQSLAPLSSLRPFDDSSERVIATTLRQFF